MSHWIALCAALGTALAASPSSGAEPVSPEPGDPKPAEQAQPAELSPEDLELLEWLELLEEFELLGSWDPSENLPIPSSAVSEPPEDSP